MSDCWNTLALVVAALFVRWLVAMHPHSGQGKPPMFGDFEAQRHWMEITVNLPIDEWYRNTSRNDLMYWGLDYPVLTAYHSFALGKIGRLFNSTWMDLFKSRGLEYYNFKLFMRATVISSDVLIFIPIALWLLKICRKVYERSESNSFVVVASVILLSPSLILIDHGHFQYNCVSLGLALAAFACFISVPDVDGRLFVRCCLGSAFFVMALLYKQMELYHALPVFFFLLSKCFHQKNLISNGLSLLACIGSTVVATFITVLLPFLLPSYLPVLDVFRRMFPVDRGLYEDKVASFWCALSTVWKFQSVITVEKQLMMCAAACLLSFTPAAFLLLRKPSGKTLLPAVVISSLSFFLFSYHVHEKSILLAICSAVFLLEVAPIEVIWFSAVSTTSMLPLLMKDGLLVAFCGIEFVWLSVVVFYLGTRKSGTESVDKFLPRLYLAIRPFLIILSVVTGVVISLCLITGRPTPPANLPFLYPLLIALHSCAHFLLFLVMFYCILYGYVYNDTSTKKVVAAGAGVMTRSTAASAKKLK